MSIAQRVTSSLLFMVVTAALWSAVRSTPPPVPLQVGQEVEMTSCRPDPAELRAWALTPPGVWNGNSGVLDGPASVVLPVCGPGQLKFTAEASVVDGWGALMLVHLDDRLLLEQEVRAARHFSIRVPASGTVRISFPNDRYESDVRGLILSRVRLEKGAACGQGNPQVRGGRNAPRWHESWGGALYDKSEFLVESCGPGVLRLRVLGISGQDEAPRLRVTQQGRVLFATKAEGLQQYGINIPDGGTISISVENGYAHEVANRSLSLRNLTFRANRDEPRR